MNRPELRAAIARTDQHAADMARRCVFCDTGEARASVCENCRSLLPWNRHCCIRCATPLDARTGFDAPCADCQKRPPAFHAALAPLRYEFPVDTALKALKFRHDLSYAPALAVLTAAMFANRFPDCDALVPVPLHRWRHALRGFNQAYEIASQLGRRIGVPVRNVASRVRATRAQTGLGTAARRANVRNAFAMQKRLHGRFPVIVDDVMTTGATCNQLARTLLENGAEQVMVFTVARA